MSEPFRRTLVGPARVAALARQTPPLASATKAYLPPRLSGLRIFSTDSSLHRAARP
jgi:hypothetical protein